MMMKKARVPKLAVTYSSSNKFSLSNQIYSKVDSLSRLVLTSLRCLRSKKRLECALNLLSVSKLAILTAHCSMVSSGTKSITWQ